MPGTSIVPKGNGFKFTAPGGSTCITRILVKENTRTPGLFKVTLKTKQAWPQGTAVEPPANTIMQLQVGGRCFIGNATKVSP